MNEMRVAFTGFDELLPLAKLKASRFQRNKHPKDQIERLAKIMREHGVRQPIHISSLTGEVCFGHGRWEAAKLNGWKEYPVVRQDFKTEYEEYACVQSDNGIASWAELDLAAINTDLANLGPDFDIELLGIRNFALDVSEIVDFPDLATGDRSELQQITFTLHKDQMERVEEALAKAKELGEFPETGNENANGNALERICEIFLGNVNS